MFKNKGEEKQRFSLRKLTVGVASVLLGITFLSYGTNEVSADANTPADSTQQVQDNKANDEVSSDKADAQNLNKVDQPKVEKATPAVQENHEEGSLPTDYTDDQIRDAVGLGKNDADISADQLAKLGLKPDEYIKEVNGQPLVYKLDTSVKFWTPSSAPIQEGNPLKTVKLNLHHNADGTVALPDFSMNGFDPNSKIGYALGNFGMTMDIVPVDTGSTIYVQKGHELTETDASKGVNKNGYSSDATLTWDTAEGTPKVDTNKLGKQTGVVDVTYKNKVGTTVEVPVVVVDLKGKTVYVTKDDPTPAPSSVITTGTTEVVPSDNNTKWTTTGPDTSKLGKQEVEVTITYPDHSTGTTTATVIVSDPKGQDTTVHINAPTPEPTTAVDPKTYPEKSTVEWVKAPDTSKEGPQDVSVIVTYPDGTKTKPIPSTVTVIGAKGHDITVNPGETPDPKTVITNVPELPGDPQIEWKTIPDTSKPGSKVPGTVVVTWTDGTTQEVPTTITVKDNGTDKVVAKRHFTRTVRFGYYKDGKTDWVDLADPVKQQHMFYHHQVVTEDGTVIKDLGWFPDESFTFDPVAWKTISGWHPAWANKNAADSRSFEVRNPLDTENLGASFDEIVYAPYVKNDETKKDQHVGTITVNRHVHFVEQGNESVDLAPEKVQTLHFDVYADVKNGKVQQDTIYLKPANGKFANVLPVSISGYTVIASEADGVGEQSATPRVHANSLDETLDLDSYLHYTKDNTNPGTPGTPDYPSQPTNNVQPKPEVPDVPETPETPDNGDNDNNVRPLPQDKDNGDKGSKTVRPHATRVQKFHSDNTRALAAANKVLPRTGNKDNSFIAAIGVAIAAVGSLFGLASRKKNY